jgi:hypothetical protein
MLLGRIINTWTRNSAVQHTQKGTKMKISKIIRNTDGTALCFVDTSRSEDSLYNLIESKFCDRHWFTGWDKTDTGFEFNFDMSCYFDSSHFDTPLKYYQALEFSIIDQTGFEFTAKPKRINADFRLEAAE